MMSHDVWLEYAYQELEERSVSFEEFCKQEYEEAFASKDDAEWEGYKEWVHENYKELEERWKYES